MLRENPSMESFFKNEGDNGETFFIKNLENVQGDERDVIYISVGYGKTMRGNISQNFGSINRKGGEKNLNVLISRARLNMEVFCNFRADDLNISSNTSFGLRAFKNFLKFVETGKLICTSEKTGKALTSPFEDEVISVIRGLGYEAEAQIGSAGFSIDIGVRNPKNPEHYLLAVECDGASYQRLGNARDRDRIRPSVLEGLGWRLYRIWSTDWFRDPHNEILRLKKAIHLAQAYFDNRNRPHTRDDTFAEKVARKIPRKNTLPKIKVNTKPYRISTNLLNIFPGERVCALPFSKIQSLIRQIVEIEGPVHIKEAAKRITEKAGYSRLEPQVLAHIENASHMGSKEKIFHHHDHFIYLDTDKTVELRNRKDIPDSSKKIEYVPLEELTLALRTVIGTSFSIDQQDAISAALEIIGFNRVTSRLKEPIESLIKDLLDNSTLSKQGNKLELECET